LTNNPTTNNQIEGISMSTSPITPPTIGRRVHFWPAGVHLAALSVFDPTQPCDAGVIYVWGDRMVNLDVTGPSGSKLAACSVTFVQPGDEPPVGQSYAEWMPYQKQQAAEGTAVKLIELTPAPLILPVATVTYGDGAQVTGVPPLPPESPAS